MSKRQAASRARREANLGILFGHGWGKTRTHGVVVVVAEGIGETPMGATVGLGGYVRE